jgi:DNA polymerase III subunit gamma/tau
VNYLVLARKWRPETFRDLVGQGHVSQTLNHAIEQDRVAHSFLFTGVRGVGKTTSARILAKALNCVEGPTIEPCLKCSQCIEIAQGNDTDVQEIDGASYNGVDEVRRLQESLPYRPQRDRFKIIIVDEVHMLSNNAWNAFLKTLEEPPPHVKFIFATTEVHKVPITILSRCQRYDFKMISAQEIAQRVRYVLGEEKIEADDTAINLVAREAAGSMRDAMSLLDQAIAWGGEKLIGEEVAKVLGVASRGALQELASALVNGDAEQCLHIAGQLVEQGYEVSTLARDTLSHLRDLVVAKICKDPGNLLDLSDHERGLVQELSKATDADDLVRLHQGFSQAFDDIVRSSTPRSAFEMALIRLARRPPMIPIDDLLRRLGELERKLTSGNFPPPASGGGVPSGPRSGPVPPSSGPSSRNLSSLPSAGGQAHAQVVPKAYANANANTNVSRLPVTNHQATALAVQVPPAPQPAVAPPETRPKVIRPGIQEEPRLNQHNHFTPHEQPRPAVPPHNQRNPQEQQPQRRPSVPPNAPPLAAPPPIQRQGPPPTHHRPPQRQPGPQVNGNNQNQSPFGPPPNAPGGNQGRSAQPGPQPRTRTQPAASKVSSSNNSATKGTTVSTSSLVNKAPPPLPPAREGVDMKVWRDVVNSLQDSHGVLSSILEMAAPFALNEQEVTLAFPPGSFLAGQLSDPAAMNALTEAIRKHYGKPTEVKVVATPEATQSLTLSILAEAAEHEKWVKARQDAEAHPMIQAARQFLGAEVRDIRFTKR